MAERKDWQADIRRGRREVLRAALGGVGGLRGAAIVLGLQPPHFLLQQHLAFDGLLMLALQLLMRDLDLLETLVQDFE